MSQTVRIINRFNGPPTTGNGGYVCGILGVAADFDAEVMLKIPPPLEKDLTLNTQSDLVELFDGETLVGIANPKEIDPPDISCPDLDSVKEASKNYLGFSESHPFPTCFVCGPRREPSDGLSIYSGRVSGTDIFAAPWIPDQTLANENSIIKDEFIWSALDCPGSFAIMDKEIMKIVLGKMAVKIIGQVKAGEECIVLGWKTGNERRKHYCKTALFNSKKELCAYSEAIWIDIGGKK